MVGDAPVVWSQPNLAQKICEIQDAHAADFSGNGGLGHHNEEIIHVPIILAKVLEICSITLIGMSGVDIYRKGFAVDLHA